MPFLLHNPMTERCLTVAGRQRSSRLVIMWLLVASLAVVLLGLVLLPGFSGESDPRALAAGGGRLLDLVATLQVAAACILTPLVMAAALQRDADPVAWDVQRSTPLPSWRLVTGLLAGRLLPVVALVLATAPALLLLRVAGGVPLGSVLASTTVALAVACVGASAAIALATARLGGRRSITTYLVLIAAALGVTWGLDAAMAPGLDGAGRRTMTVATGFNPFLVLDAQLRPGSTAPSTHWWIGHPLRSFLLLSGVLFVLCWLCAMVLSTRDASLQVQGHDADRPPRPIGRRPIAWRESRGRPHVFVVDLIRWTLAACVLGGGIFLALAAVDSATVRALLGPLLSVAVLALLMIATLLSASAVARERDDRTLDLLLTTPLEPGDYLRGKLLGLARVMWPPTLAVMLVALCIAIVGWTAPPAVEGESSLLAAGMLPGGAMALALSLPGLLATGIAIGLTWSVRSRKWTMAAAAGLIMTALATGGAALIASLAGGDIPALGTLLVGGVPLVVAQAASDPAGWLDLARTDLASLNQQLLIGGCVGAIVWFIAALGILRATSLSFTATVRRLAGLD